MNEETACANSLSLKGASRILPCALNNVAISIMLVLLLIDLLHLSGTWRCTL